MDVKIGSKLTKTNRKEQETLSASLSNLLTSQKYTDFTIKCGDEVFPCHKAIL